MKHRLCAWFLVALAAAACGGKTEVTGETAAAGAGGAQSGGAGAAGKGGQAGGPVGGASGAGNATGQGGAAGSAGAAGVGGAAGSATEDVLCGWGMCAVPAQFCCVSFQPDAQECKPVSEVSTCGGGSAVAMLCDGPEDCDGKLCCGQNGSGVPFVGPIQCADTCPFDDWHVMFCHPWASDVCPNGMTCKQAPLLSTFYSCQPI